MNKIKININEILAEAREKDMKTVKKVGEIKILKTLLFDMNFKTKDLETIIVKTELSKKDLLEEISLSIDILSILI